MAATSPRQCGRIDLVARQDHVLDDRIDLVFPAFAGKHAVVADASLHVGAFEAGAKRLAQVVGRDGLADRADVVTLALDCQQHCTPDRARIDGFAAPFQPAARQRVFLESDVALVGKLVDAISATADRAG